MPANVAFDETELASLGLSVRGINARQMAPFKVEQVEILGAAHLADLSTKFEESQTVVTGDLGADSDDWPNFTKANWIARLDTLKAFISPMRGFRKLHVAGDADLKYRWCRYQEMSLTEEHPVFRVPFQRIGITFQNLEPYWRTSNPPVSVSTLGGTIAYGGQFPAKPTVRCEIAKEIFAYKGAVVQPVALFQIADLVVMWRGTETDADGILQPGDTLVIDSETMTVLVERAAGGTATDVVRHYDYGGPDAYLTGGGFPVIQPSSSSLVSNVHAGIASLIFNYDVLSL